MQYTVCISGKKNSTASSSCFALVEIKSNTLKMYCVNRSPLLPLTPRKYDNAF